MTDDKTKRKKLTLSSGASPKSLDNLSLAREKNKKSVLIEKKVPRRRNIQRFTGKESTCFHENWWGYEGRCGASK